MFPVRARATGIPLTMIDLIDASPPSFGVPEALPATVPDEYLKRQAACAERMRRRGLDALVVYGDREHFANLAYLCGYDPRFEEGVLLMDAAGRVTLLVGNEGLGYLPEGLPDLRVRLFQELSLLGQPRGDSPPLRELLREFGFKAGQRVGCVGWKFYRGGGVEGGELAIELPAFLVDLLREMTGSRERVVNATDLFMGVEDGLRTVCSADEIAQLEFAATRSSEAVWGVIRHLRVGATERELSRHQNADGLPSSCHAMVSTGPKARRGLASPSDRRVALGDPFTTAVGLWGSLTARAGFVARGPEDVPAEARPHYEALAANYFAVMVAWYEAVRVGATGGEVFAAADAARDDARWSFALNPGHYIHLDEWLHSPFVRGGGVTLRSGAAIQMDIIPVSKGPFCAINGEDGVVLADAALREEIAGRYPDAARRMAARGDFMRDTLGIRLHESVWPLSSYPALLPPYLLAPNRVLAKVG